MSLGTTGCRLEWFSTRAGLCAQIIFADPDAARNLARFETVPARRVEFEQALSRTAMWDVKPGRKSTLIVLRSDFPSVTDRERWPQMIDGLMDAQSRLRDALDTTGGIPRV